MPTAEDIARFGKIYDRNERDGKYRRRSVREMNEMYDGYRVLKSTEGEPLGGISMARQDEDTEFGTIWATIEKAGIAAKLVETAVPHVNGRIIGLTRESRSAFLKSGFISRGYVSENSEMPDMPEFIRSYDLSKRKLDPEIFVLDRTTETQ